MPYEATIPSQLAEVQDALWIEPMLRRRPRKLMSKLYAAASANTALKVAWMGDSLAAVKANHMVPTLDRMFGASNTLGTNTAGSNYSGSCQAGSECALTSPSGVTSLTGRYDLWPTGSIDEFAIGAFATYTYSAVNPSFTKIRVYFVKEPGAGTVALTVGGVAVASASADNATVDVGYVEWTQTYAQASVRIDVSIGVVHVISAHWSNSGTSGVEFFKSMAFGGLSLLDAMGNAQGRTIFQAYLTLVGLDFIGFEMDDNFGAGGATDAAWGLFSAILTAAAPYADKLIIGSTPRATDDAGKIASSAYLRAQCAAGDASWLFFDSYRIMGSYADMVAIFGSDDGTHPNNAAQAFAAAEIFHNLGLQVAEMGFVPSAINSTAASRLGVRSKIGPDGSATRLAPYLLVDSNVFQGFWCTDYSFGVAQKNEVTCKFQISYNGSFPTILPMSCDFDSAANVRKRDTVTASGLEFTRLRKTDNPGGKQRIDVEMVRQASYTRAQLLAIDATGLIGTQCWCSDATNGAGLAVARGTSATDWVLVVDNSAI